MEEADLYRQFARRIRAYGLRHLDSVAAAEDLVQQVLIVVLEAVRGDRLREPDKLGSFVLGTCRMTAQAARRGERRRAGLLERFGERDATAAPTEALDIERLRDCLGKLPERERTIVALTFYADRDSDMIGRELGMTPGNVRVARHRALAHLHDCVSGGQP